MLCCLQFPALFSSYAALLAYMAEIHSSRLCRLPDDLLHQLMAAIDLGLTSNAGSDIAKACLELVASLAAHVCTDPALHGTMAYQVGAHFLEVLHSYLLFVCYDNDAVPYYTNVCGTVGEEGADCLCVVAAWVLEPDGWILCQMS